RHLETGVVLGRLIDNAQQSRESRVRFLLSVTVLIFLCVGLMYRARTGSRLPKDRACLIPRGSGQTSTEISTQRYPFGPAGPNAAPPIQSSGLTIFNALQDQLGLRLQSEKGPVDFIVIDSAEKPTEN